MDDNILEHVICFPEQGVLYTKGEKNALFDCGMAHMLPVEVIKQKLGDALLDYVFLTHSHYDHIGALPYIKEAWPDCQVLGSAYAQYVLTRPGALATIRQYSQKAAAIDGVVLADYSDSRMKIDAALADGEIVELGGTQVQAVELLGHTKCSMGYFIDGTLLIGSESTGYLNEYQEVIPSYLVSARAALHSAVICRMMNPQIIIPPHGTPLLAGDCPDFWEKCAAAIHKAQSLILDGYQSGKTEAEILTLLKDMYWNGEIRIAQPEFAFETNTEVMIRVTLAEAGIS